MVYFCKSEEHVSQIAKAKNIVVWNKIACLPAGRIITYRETPSGSWKCYLKLWELKPMADLDSHPKEWRLNIPCDNSPFVDIQWLQIVGDNIFLIPEWQFPVNFDIRFNVGLTPLS